MKKLDRQLYFMVLFPWVLAVFFLLKSPSEMLPILRSKIGVIAIAGLIIWEILGVKTARKFIKDDDARAWMKILPIILIFFLPVVFAIVLGPIAFQLYISR